MITSIKIKNFKSVVDLSLDLGRFNVLIGENGCGKSNILEALAFGAAASADKLDYEFLGSRGIRLTNSDFITSAFSGSNHDNIIELLFERSEGVVKEHSFRLDVDSTNPKKWRNIQKDLADDLARKLIERLVFQEKSELNKLLLDAFPDDDIKILIEAVDTLRNNLDNVDISETGQKGRVDFFNSLYESVLQEKYSNKNISDFIIYTPEQSNLRRFEISNQIYPLGVKGEGLFQYLKDVLLNKSNRKEINDIKKMLSLLGWYENFSLPKNLLHNEFTINIKDKYLDDNLKYFDQRSANEGFLFLLFYSTLFVSKETPSFFAIDNIDTALNPKLCRQLIENLSGLAKKYNKQVILTTHNPAILDGLDLKDDSQRLFVVRRNDEGHTRVKRIEYKPNRKMKLSEIWTNGFIGGLPDNF